MKSFAVSCDTLRLGVFLLGHIQGEVHSCNALLGGISSEAVLRILRTCGGWGEDVLSEHVTDLCVLVLRAVCSGIISHTEVY